MNDPRPHRRETSSTPRRWAFVLEEHKHLLEPVGAGSVKEVRELLEGRETRGEDVEPMDRSFLDPWRKRQMTREEIGRKLLQIDDGAAQLVVSGPLVPWVTFDWNAWEFNPTTDDYLAAVEYVEKRADITWLHLWIDSPGGTDYGTFELANALWRLRETTGTSCFTAQMMASAAYWIGSQVEHVLCSQIADVGSVGGYVLLHDWTRFDEEFGVATELVRTGGEGSIKGDGAAGRVTEGLKANVGKRLEESVAYFLEGVARGRGFDRARVDQIPHGHLWLGNEALSRGLVDEVQPSREAAWAKVLELSGATHNPAPATPAAVEGDDMSESADTKSAGKADPNADAAKANKESMPETVDVAGLAAQLQDERQALAKELEASRRERATRAAEKWVDGLGDKASLAMCDAGLVGLAAALEISALKIGERTALEVLHEVVAAVPALALPGGEPVAASEPHQPGGTPGKAMDGPAGPATQAQLSEDEQKFLVDHCGGDAAVIEKMIAEGSLDLGAGGAV